MFKSTKPGQNGLTLIEMLIALLITSIVGVSVAAGVQQILKLNSRNSDHQIVVNQLQNGTNSVSHETLQAKQVTPLKSDGTAKPLDTGKTTISFNLLSLEQLKISWTNWNDNTTHQVVFSATNISTNNYKLIQTTQIVASDGFTVISTTTTVAATNISSANGNWDTYSRVLTFNITSQKGNSTLSRTLQLIPRAAQQ